MTELIQSRCTRKVKASPLQDISVPVCRICLEPPEEKVMISPCKCRGSVSHVHEECLKTWLRSKFFPLEGAKCEICRAEFPMMWEFESTCIFHKLIRQNFGKFLLVPILFVLELMLIVLVSVLVDNIESTDSSKKIVLSSVLIGICGLIFFCLLVFILVAIKKLYIVEEVTDWSIKNYLDLSQEEENQVDKKNKTLHFETSPALGFDVLSISEEQGFVHQSPKIKKAKTVRS